MSRTPNNPGTSSPSSTSISAASASGPGTDFPAAPVDLRLVVVDMDGTLLDGEGRLPADLPRVLDRLHTRGITFAPASGRQYATLRDMFAGDGEDDGAPAGAPDGAPAGAQAGAHVGAPAGVTTFIAENGNVVVRDGEMTSADGIDPAIVDEVIAAVRTARAEGKPLGLVVCHPECAYVEADEAAFLDESAKYYHSLEVVGDLGEAREGAVKLAVFDADGSESTAAQLMHRRVGDRLDVAVSGEWWVDMMAPGSHKGHAVRELQEQLGVTPAQTAVFGDLLNDLEMMGTGELSFAMANAHPDVKAAANYGAPANTEAGVIVVLDRLLDEADSATA